MIDPNEIPSLWRIAHDRTEVPAGVFLEELAALDVLFDRPPLELSQQTLSNYVKRGFVPRKRISTAPGGRGQTGYFERRALIAVLDASEWHKRFQIDESARRSSNFADTYAVDMLVGLVRDIYGDGLLIHARPVPGLLTEPHFDDRDLVLALLERAAIVRFLALILDPLPTTSRELAAFVPDSSAQQAIKLLRALQRLAKTDVVTPDLHRDWGIFPAIEVWLSSNPAAVTSQKASRIA